MFPRQLTLPICDIFISSGVFTEYTPLLLSKTIAINFMTTFFRVRGLSLYLFTVSVLFLPAFGQASITLGSTRLVYHEADDSIALQLNNYDNLPYLLQSWVALTPDNLTSAQAASQNVPFIVTPPLFRMNGGDKNQLNIVKTSVSLPNDRESIFYLNIKAIPGRPDKAGNSLMIAVKSTLKLFYRPTSLSDEGVEKAWSQLTFVQNGGKLTISNPSPYFITFYSLTADDAQVKVGKNAMIPPFSQQTYALVAHHVSKVSWQTIGDLAGISKTYTQELP